MSAPFRNSNVGLVAQLVIGKKSSLHAVHIENSNGAKSYLQFYNLATVAEAIVGTTTPVKTLYIPATGGYDFHWDSPVEFSSGIVIAATTGADNAVAPAAGLLVNVDYTRG